VVFGYEVKHALDRGMTWLDKLTTASNLVAHILLPWSS